VSSQKRIFLVAGEASGDLHAANLIKAIKEKNPSVALQGFGGDRMEAAGMEVLLHYRKMAFMGFLEVILNLRTILKNIKICEESILAFKPDVLVLIDYPGFNLRIAEFAKKHGIKVVYYISPQVWAWKEKRVHKIKRVVDRMLLILPFETDFYKKYSFDTDFVGHPLLDALNQTEDEAFKINLPETKKPIIALLPGSRKQEIKTMLPVFLEIARHFPNYQFVLSKAPSQTDAFYNELLKGEKVLSVRGTYGLLKKSHAALVTSGTATLETALFEVPQVVCYKGSYISYRLARSFIKVKYISLVNLILDRELVPEMIQQDFTSEKVGEKLKQICEGEVREKQQSGYVELKQKLGGGGASEKAAAIVLEEIEV
jgi:lipid-A-disaccharide synthase